MGPGHSNLDMASMEKRCCWNCQNYPPGKVRYGVFVSKLDQERQQLLIELHMLKYNFANHFLDNTANKGRSFQVALVHVCVGSHNVPTQDSASRGWLHFLKYRDAAENTKEIK